VLVLDGEHVLLGVRGKEPHRGSWVLPGGKIRPYESIAAAAKREVAEETGLDIRVGSPLAVREVIDPPDEHRVIIFSLAEVAGGSLVAGSDIETARFWHYRDLSGLSTTPTVASVLDMLDWTSIFERDKFAPGESAAFPPYARAVSSP
jgi:8-oxo-dGTP diphosphatase